MRAEDQRRGGRILVVCSRFTDLHDVKDMFHGFNYKRFFELSVSERVPFMPQAMEHILKEQGKKERFARETTALLKAFSLAVPREEAMEIKEDVGLFQAIK